ncbi:MAG: SpoIIE family protein phosphatase [Victivallaceae bacterium]|nr:SpoIIE family protein phosphatase [Victivallaceae bacterium]
MSNKRIGIKAKILIFMLVLTSVTFSLAAVLTLGNIRALGNFTLGTCDKLENKVLKDSKDALLSRAREELQSLVVGQAMIANVQLDRLDDEVAMLANLAMRYLVEKNPPAAGGDERRFLTVEQPDPPLSKSRIMVFASDSGEKYERNMARMGRLHPLLKFIYGNQHNLDLVYLCTVDGYYITYPWTQRRKKYSPFQRRWYKDAVKTFDRTVWVGPYISAHGNKIIMSCARAVRNFQGKVIAVCAFDITVNELTRGFISSRLVPSGRAFLLDKEGNVLARRKMKSGGMQWYDNYRTENLLESGNRYLRQVAAKMVAGGEGVEKISGPGNSELYVAYAPVALSGWSIGVMVEAAVLTASVDKTEAVMKRNVQVHRDHVKSYFDRNLRIYLVTGMIVLAVVIIWGMTFSRRITAPILLLKQKALQIMNGDFNSGIHLHTGDELERLDATFDRMTADITRYMEHVGTTVREREKTDQEFAVASDIQSFMLPSEFKGVPELEIEAYLKPARSVSGDFYNYFMVDRKHLFFCIGKVSGRGMPAAMLMVRVMTLLCHLGIRKIEPEKLLHTVNNTLSINNKARMSVAVCCGLLDIETGQLRYSGAGHIPVIYLHGREVDSLQAETAPMLEADPGKEGIFSRNSLRLKPGDILFLTTNGINRVINTKGEVFGETYLVNSFRNFRDSGGSVINFILAQLRSFYGARLAKRDVTLLAIEYKGRKA